MKKDQEMYEFKGNTEATLNLILEEIRGLRNDVDDLKGWKFTVLGFSAATGFIAGFIRDIFVSRRA